MPHPGRLEDFVAPWDKGNGEFDTEQARTLVYNARLAEHTAQEEARTAKQAAETATAKVREFESATLTADQKKDQQIADLQRQVQEGSKVSRDTLLLEVALEQGLTRKQAARLQGNTKEEIEADAKEYVAEHGLGKGEQAPAVRGPRNPLRTGAEGDGGEYEDLSHPENLLPPRSPR